MKVHIEREVDVQRLLINLNEKSHCKDPGMAGYSVTVDKQLLRDAHDVIATFVQKSSVIATTTSGETHSSLFNKVSTMLNNVRYLRWKK